MSSFDMSQYLSVFLDEAEEQLQLMNEGFIQLERDGADGELLNRIFRAAHTLKGASASMGFNKMAELTHEMENILDRVRQGEVNVGQDLTDTLLECLDTLEALKAEITSGEDRGVQIADLVDKLKKSLESEAADEKPETITNDNEKAAGSNYTETEQNLIRSAEISGFNVYSIKVELVSDCQMKSVRAYLVFNNLEDLGDIIKTIPTTEEIEEEKFDRSFELVLVSREDTDKILNTIKSISEIEDVTISPVRLSSEEESKAFGAGKPAQATSKTRQKQPRQSKKAPAMQPGQVSQTVRVDVKRLENLMNLVGELVIDRTRLADVGDSIKTRLGGELAERMEEISVHIARITTDLQEEIMKARMLPIEQVFNRFPRMVRDLAKKAGKEIDFIVDGKETELDRTVIEEVGDPLIHLLRNAIDHGIEPDEERIRKGKPAKGTIKLNAFHQENQIVISVSDDGGGIDPEKLRQKAVDKGLITAEAAACLSKQESINFIFYPGFSTAKQVSDVSGRGVGMDIVRAHIEKINGIIDIDTEVGKGTTFTIKLPLTLAINRSLLVKVRENVLAFPLVNVVEIINVERDKIHMMQNREVTVVRGNVLPLFSLSDALGWKRETAGLDEDKLQVVVAGISDKRVGFVVDDLLGEQEIVIKPLGDYVGQVPGLAGATIMGDGKVALILDVRGLVEHTGAVSSYDKAN